MVCRQPLERRPRHHHHGEGADEQLRSTGRRRDAAPGGAALREERLLRRSGLPQSAPGLYTFVRWNTIMTNPPLCINEQELAEGFAIIDKALDIADQAVA